MSRSSLSSAQKFMARPKSVLLMFHAAPPSSHRARCRQSSNTTVTVAPLILKCPLQLLSCLHCNEVTEMLRLWPCALLTCPKQTELIQREEQFPWHFIWSHSFELLLRRWMTSYELLKRKKNIGFHFSFQKMWIMTDFTWGGWGLCSPLCSELDSTFQFVCTFYATCLHPGLQLV